MEGRGDGCPRLTAAIREDMVASALDCLRRHGDVTGEDLERRYGFTSAQVLDHGATAVAGAYRARVEARLPAGLKP